jgi:hypothetical protein
MTLPPDPVNTGAGQPRNLSGRSPQEGHDDRRVPPQWNADTLTLVKDFDRRGG